MKKTLKLDENINVAAHTSDDKDMTTCKPKCVAIDLDISACPVDGKDGTNNSTITHLRPLGKIAEETEVEPEGKGHGDPKTVAGEARVDVSLGA